MGRSNVHLCFISNTILHFVVFHARFSKLNIVTTSFTRVYTKKAARPIFRFFSLLNPRNPCRVIALAKTGVVQNAVAVILILLSNPVNPV